MIIRLDRTLSVDPDSVQAISKTLLPEGDGFNVLLHLKVGPCIIKKVLRDYNFIERMIDKYTWLTNNKADWDSVEARTRIDVIQKKAIRANAPTGKSFFEKYNEEHGRFHKDDFRRLDEEEGLRRGG